MTIKQIRANAAELEQLASEWLALPQTLQGIDLAMAEAATMKKVRAYFKGLPKDLSPGQVKAAIRVTYLAGVDSSSKIIKGREQGFASMVLYLSPASSSGVNVCSEASAGCIAACLNVSGRNLMERNAGRSHIATSRLKKTWLVVFRRDLANIALKSEIAKNRAKATRAGLKFAVRLNGTSDLDFTDIFAAYPEVQFYDYTKHLSHVKKSVRVSNWHVTYSYSGTNLVDCMEAASLGANLAIPIAHSSARKGKLSGIVKELVSEGLGYSQDDTDLRFLDSCANPFGLLAVKQTPGTAEGIRQGFLLDRDGFLALRESVLAVRHRVAA